MSGQPLFLLARDQVLIYNDETRGNSVPFTPIFRHLSTYFDLY